MKSVQIEFIEDQRWRFIWIAALIYGLGLLASLVWRWETLEQSIREESELISEVQLRLQRIPAPVHHKVNPRHTSLSLAAKFLGQDLNNAFATVENLQEPGIRLRSLSLETVVDSLRLEYDLDSMVKASTLTEALNTGYEYRPWQLESISGPAGEGLMVSGTSSFRGTWSVQLKRL